MEPRHFNVESKEFEHEESVRTDWGERFELMLFQDDNFSIKVDRENLMVGEKINVAVYLVQENLKGVKFFVERCYMTNSEKMSYDIIKGIQTDARINQKNLKRVTIFFRWLHFGTCFWKLREKQSLSRRRPAFFFPQFQFPENCFSSSDEFQLYAENLPSDRD